MKINYFKAVNVHGYLDYDIKFFNELTFLIGINGSGKTTALKLILGLLSPSFIYLNQIDYEFARLVCSSNESEEDIIIESTQSRAENTFTLQVSHSNLQSSTQTFKRYFKSEQELLENDEISGYEQNIKAIFDLDPITNLIRELATPKFLGLDRKIYEGKSIDFRINRTKRYYSRYVDKYSFESNSPNSGIDSSLADVQNLIYNFLRKNALEQPKISEEFKRKIFELSFEFNDDDILWKLPNDDTELLEKKKKVLNAIKNLEIGFLDESANNFFDNMGLLMAKSKLKSLSNVTNTKLNNGKFNDDGIKMMVKWINNSSQITKIDKIIDFSQEYQEQVEELKAPIHKLESIASKFLIEGGKKLTIASDGEIQVSLRNGKVANVFELSSGEKQILIMIAHLIFEEDQKPSGVFIIDEPELSLHLAWQEIFVDAITEASPKTQFILATHSPSIIAKVSREKYCQDLYKTITDVKI
jgi:predicted ATP-binding protein involved in virulence